MKALLALLFFGLNAQANTVTLFCDDSETASSCGERVESALRDLNCNIETADTKCTHALKEDGKPSQTPYCEVTSSNCANATPKNFGGEDCFDKEPVKISKTFPVHNGYWFGFWRQYSRTVCRARSAVPNETNQAAFPRMNCSSAVGFDSAGVFHPLQIQRCK